MKQLILLLTCLLQGTISFSQVGIGTEDPDASAILDLNSTTQGLLPPRMDIAQRNAINGGLPAAGLTIYNTEYKCLETYNGTSWINLCDGCSSTITNPCDPTNPTEVVEVQAGGHTWMDRNLGASRAATGSQDFEAYGNLYQWGRGNDGHQCINWETGSASDGAEQDNESSSQSASPNPGSTFIIGFDNWYNGTNPDDLWKPNLTGVNNPCPAGYRVPSETELTDLGITNAGNAYSSIGLPLAGYRRNSNGSLGNVGTYGYYWSSSVDSTDSRRLLFTSSNAIMTTLRRANGYSVRCLKD